MALKGDKYIWNDKKRILGIPMTFTRYALSKDRLFLQTGALNIKDDETLLYRIRDISMSRSFWQRIFKVGTIKLTSSDKSTPEIILKNVKNPENVKEMIHDNVEKIKIERRVRIGEYSTVSLDDDDDIDDDDIDNDDDSN